MSWILLLLAGLFEATWAIALKYSEGFTRMWPSVITTLSMAVSLYLLAISLRTLPLGVAYTVWTGIGAISTVIYGMLIFGESKSLLKILFIAMILGGIVGLQVVTRRESTPEQLQKSKTVRPKTKSGNNA